MELGVIKGNKYVLTDEAATQQYIRYISIIHKIVESFKITK
jgi:hypothetical protein